MKANSNSAKVSYTALTSLYTYRSLIHAIPSVSRSLREGTRHLVDQFYETAYSQMPPTRSFAGAIFKFITWLPSSALQVFLWALVAVGFSKFMAARNIIAVKEENYAIESGVTQVVYLAQGLNPAPLLLANEHANINVYAVDRDETYQLYKACCKTTDAQLTEFDHSFTINEQLHVIDHDLSLPVENLRQRLEKLGFDPMQPTLFVTSGLSMYLNKDELSNLLTGLSNEFTGNNRIFIDILNKPSPKGRIGQFFSFIFKRFLKSSNETEKFKIAPELLPEFLNTQRVHIDYHYREQLFQL